MLASLTGLLLTLGGDQPAVVFDPPLDPAIFDWDGTTLRIRSDSLPLDLSFPEPLPPYSSNQKMIFNQTAYVQTPVEIIDFSTGVPQEVKSAIKIWGEYDDCDGDCDASWYDEDFAEDGAFIEAGSVVLLAGVQSQVSSFILTVKTDNSGPSGGGKDERITELEEKVEALEQAIESCQCASDLDGDGSVGFTDLVELISVWGPCSA